MKTCIRLLIPAFSIALLLAGCAEPSPEEQMAMGAGELEDGQHGDIHNDAETTMGTENLVEGTLRYLDEGDGSN